MLRHTVYTCIYKMHRVVFSKLLLLPQYHPRFISQRNYFESVGFVRLNGLSLGKSSGLKSQFSSQWYFPTCCRSSFITLGKQEAYFICTLQKAFHRWPVHHILISVLVVLITYCHPFYSAVDLLILKLKNTRRRPRREKKKYDLKILTLVV